MKAHAIIVLAIAVTNVMCHPAAQDASNIPSRNSEMTSSGPSSGSSTGRSSGPSSDEAPAGKSSPSDAKKNDAVSTTITASLITVAAFAFAAVF
uniref:AlNc14C340G10785 protein n=1 Tax=Albugo laibachii Nc14 TaxID=890382 RepID=F0WX28_9STRA|nr:AlNc14C340G10785 [Albugo laibachii Nc14]|eukprot:CCA26017.1 AlNc14C340G10785 [Albugo laibachii Nc14]